MNEIIYSPSDKKYLESKLPIRGEVYEDLSSFKSIGFQGSKLYEAYDLLKKFDYNITLGFTSNVITCGLREIIAKLCEYKLINGIVTSGGGVEEDIIKTHLPFRYESLKYEDLDLRLKGINRSGNILCSNEGYVWLESFLKNLGSSQMYNTTPMKLVKLMRKNLKDPTSYLYWTEKNNIPVFPVNLEDGAIGDHYSLITFQKLAKLEEPPCINCVDTLYQYTKYLKGNKNCIIMVGAGAVKHFVMNGAIPVGGSDLTIYFNNEVESEGSNAGATVEQTISWGKTNEEGICIKIQGDFVFSFYLFASQLIKDHEKQNRIIY